MAESLDHILVDEFQDTNDQQYKLIKLLKHPGTGLYVVGDPTKRFIRGAALKKKLFYILIVISPELKRLPLTKITVQRPTSWMR